MTKEKVSAWKCPCSNEFPYEVEFCPECGTHRDFVLGKGGAAPSPRRPDSDGGVAVEVEKPRGFPWPHQPRRGLGRWTRRFGGFSWERYRRPLRWAVNLAILLALYWVSTAVADYLRQPPLQMLQSPIAGSLAVAVEEVKPERIAATVTYTGTVAPIQEVTVYPRVQGWLLDFNLYDGDPVRKGQVIARLDRTELGAAVAQAQELVAAGEQHLAQVEASIGAHKARVAEAEAAVGEAEANLIFWQKEQKRTEALFKGGAVAESELDNARRQLAVAQGKRDAQRAKVESHRAQLRVAEREPKRIEAMLKSRRAELARRSTVLTYTDVIAPIAGEVAKRHVYSGILVKPGMPIVDLADTRTLRVQAKVAEKDLPRVRVGTPAVVRISSLPNPHNLYETKVSTIFPKLDPVTRTSTVEMVIENPQGLLKPDMYAVVDLILESRERALTVPRRAVVDVEGKPTVFVAKGQEAVAKPVKLGLVSGERVEVLEGLQEGDLVIYQGNRGLVSGQEVAVVARR